MAIITIPGVVPLDGWDPIQKGMRNGVVPPGQRVRDLTTQLNAVLARRLKVHFRKWIAQGDAYNSTAQANTWRAMFWTSPTATKLRARMVLAPTDDTVANAPTPQLFWTLTPVGGGASAQVTVFYNVRVAGGATIVPNDLHDVTQDWTVTANTEYELLLTQKDKLRILGATVWEVPNDQLDTSTQTGVVPDHFAVGLPIYDLHYANLVSAITTCFKRQGTSWLQWTRPSTTAFTTTSATYVNVLNAATTAWGANSEGFYTYPRYHGAFETVDSATNRETVPIKFAAYIQTSDAAQTVTAALIDQNNGTGAPIATVTRTGATSAAWVTTTADWSAPSNADTMKLDVMLKITGGATGSIYAASAYDHQA